MAILAVIATIWVIQIILVTIFSMTSAAHNDTNITRKEFLILVFIPCSFIWMIYTRLPKNR